MNIDTSVASSVASQLGRSGQMDVKARIQLSVLKQMKDQAQQNGDALVQMIDDTTQMVKGSRLDIRV